MTTSYEQQQLDLVAENEALSEALDNMIDGANVWSDLGNCCYCNGRNHKEDCDYKAAISLLEKVKLRNQ